MITTAQADTEPVSKSPYQLENSFDRKALQLPHGRRKAYLFNALTPPDCESVLDAGGGTGWATVVLRKGRRVVTLDSSAESLAHAQGETVLAGVDNLPFEAGSFDMVLSSQVLEHLPDALLRRATSEMDRVARRYLLVSVPYREALETRFVRCATCGNIFHPDYHCRAFSERDLAKQFPCWIMAEWHVFGALRWAVGVDPLKPPRLKRPSLELPPAPDTTICPRCGEIGAGGDALPARGSFARRILASTKHRLSSILPSLASPEYPTFLPQNVAPYWIAALFIREGADPIDNPMVEHSYGG